MTVEELIEKLQYSFHCSYRGDCLGTSCKNCGDYVLDYSDFKEVVDKAKEE